MFCIKHFRGIYKYAILSQFGTLAADVVFVRGGLRAAPVLPSASTVSFSLHWLAVGRAICYFLEGLGC